MRRVLAVAVISLLSLVACTSGGSQGSAPDTKEPGVPSPVSDAENSSGPRATCSARTATSFDGKRMAVRFRITPCRLARGDAPEAVLVNTGDGELGYSFGFKLERRTGEGWRWINKRQAFPLPLFYLAPDARSNPESLAVYFGKPKPIELRPGLYRVTKSVDLTPGNPRPPTMEVRATFRVV